MHSTRRMDEGVFTSEKWSSGIEEKMPEISRELNWLRSWHVSMFRNFLKWSEDSDGGEKLENLEK